MNKFKMFVIFAIGMTIGEFLTMWRLRPNGETFEQFIKTTLQVQQKGMKQTATGIEQLLDGHIDEGKKNLRHVMNPNQL